MKSKTPFLAVFLAALLVSCAFAKKNKHRTGGSGSSHNSRPTSKPQTHSGGSNPGTIGWNVGSKPNPVNNNPVGHPSSFDPIHKNTGTNVQSSNQNWNPSGGYNSHHQPQTNNQPYNPSVGGGYNTHTPYGGSPSYNPPPHPPPYNPQPYAPPYNPQHYAPPSYNPSYSHNAPPPYNPSYSANAPPPYNPYNPSMGHSYSPGAGYNPPVGHAPQTVIVQSDGGSNKPGLGQLAKEAFVYAGVNAGVNAAVNRILPGGISGHNYNYPTSGTVSSNNGVVPPVSHTQITYNNYYNNGTSVPAEGQQNPQAVPSGQPTSTSLPVSSAQPSLPTQLASSTQSPTVTPSGENEGYKSLTNTTQTPLPPPSPLDENKFPSPSGAIVTKSDFQQLTEELFENDKNNAYKYITVQLQGQKMDDSVKDDAPEPLLVVKDEAYEIPTIKAVLALHDNYALDVKTKEVPTGEKRKEENDMIDLFLDTDVMKTAMKFLSDKGFLPEYEYKDSLKRIWFSLFKRIDGDAGSSGFETIFLAEKFDSEIIGMHNWIYYAKQEAAKNMNYLGYIKETKLGTNGTVVKLRSSLNSVVQPVTTIFVGTSPELEMALYTMCFYVRPNLPCPIKLGGSEFIIIANAINYFGKDILISAYPEI